MPLPVTEALWGKVLEDFAADKSHEAFLLHCQQCDLLSEAARRYSAYKSTLNEDQTDERDAIDRRLGAVALLAMSQLDDLRTPPAVVGRKVLTAVAAVLAIVSVIGIAMLATM